jgi:hypothetical protein
MIFFKYTLYDISIATHACLCFGGGGGIGLVNNLPDIHPKPVFIYVNRLLYCKQQIAGSSFLILQFAKRCLLMG